jgi:hypothetical protein
MMSERAVRGAVAEPLISPATAITMANPPKKIPTFTGPLSRFQMFFTIASS